jgi:hypothetical protein
MEKMEGVTQEVAEKLLMLQPRCIVCGSTFALHIHHRIFKSEGNSVLERHLVRMADIYFRSYGKPLHIWSSIHAIQNLCVLCLNHHEGNIIGVHGGNEKLRQQLRNSFTCPITGFSVSFYKDKTKLY